MTKLSAPVAYGQGEQCANPGARGFFEDGLNRPRVKGTSQDQSSVAWSEGYFRNYHLCRPEIQR